MMLLLRISLLFALLFHTTTTTCLAIPEATVPNPVPAQRTKAPMPATTVFIAPLMPSKRNYGRFDRPAPPPYHGSRLKLLKRWPQSDQKKLRGIPENRRA